MLVALGFLLWRQHFVQELERQGLAPDMAHVILEKVEQDEQYCPFPAHLVPKVRPRGKGGPDAYGNLQLLHLYCHQQITARGYP